MDGQVDKNRLIKAILKKDHGFLRAKEVGLSPEKKNAPDTIEVSDEEKETFYRRIMNGQIGKADFDAIIGLKPFGDFEKVFELIRDNKYKRRIIAYMTGMGFDNYESVTKESLEKFVKRYPSPVAFEPAKNDFLLAIGESNPEQKYLDYKREIEELVQEIYGEKAKIFELYFEFVKEAEEWQIEKDAARLTAEFLPRAEILGDSWLQNGQEYTLTTDLLKKVGLYPSFYLEMGGAEVALSKAFKVDVHEAVIAYVRLNNQTKVRGYYRSNSQAMWRLLADYVAGNGEIAWYGVGFNEESLTLPMRFQKELNYISARGVMEVPGVNMGFFLGGTAKRYASKEEYRKAVDEGTAGSDYYREMEHEPRLNFGVISNEKHPPFSVDIEDENGPNFRNQLDHYMMKTEMYGEVTVRQFPSLNDELRYLVCEVGKKNEKKAWIGTIEVNAPMTSVGLTSGWVSSGDICTPLFEYQTMTGGYGAPIGGGGAESGQGSNGPQGSSQLDGYESMWEKYLSQMPIIKKYLYTWGNAN